MRPRSTRRATAARTAAIIPILAILALTAMALVGPTVHAYIGQNPYVVKLSGPSGTVQCDRDVTITATVTSSTSGVAVAHQVVSWDIRNSASSRDRLSDTSTSTDSNGKTSVKLSFGGPGSRQVRVTIAAFSKSLNVKCEGSAAANPTPKPPTPTQRPHATPRATQHGGGGQGGVPPTSTAPLPPVGVQEGALDPLATLLLVLVASVLIIQLHRRLARG